MWYQFRLVALFPEVYNSKMVFLMLYLFDKIERSLMFQKIYYEAVEETCQVQKNKNELVVSKLSALDSFCL